METANEGGAWGMALLAQYLNYAEEMSLEDYLDNVVFDSVSLRTYEPSEEEIIAYDKYVERYENNIDIEKVAQNFK